MKVGKDAHLRSPVERDVTRTRGEASLDHYAETFAETFFWWHVSFAK